MGKRLYQVKGLYGIPGSGSRKNGTARRQRFGDCAAVLLFLLLLPYACSLLFGRGMREKEKGTTEPAREGLQVVCDGKTGEETVSLEEFVEGALAASIPVGCREETLKAQAVILRTLCVRAWLDEQNGGLWQEGMEDSEISGRKITGQIGQEKTGQEYLPPLSRERQWGDRYEEYAAQMEQAVRQTEGEILIRQGGRVAEPAYCWLAAGKTRDGKEVLGEEYGYMKSVDCTLSGEAEEGTRTVRVSGELFWKTLDCTPDSRLLLTRDSADYVLRVEVGGQKISGERFRELFGLASSCFLVNCQDGEVVMTSSGVGHGLGLCQYEADLMAAQGAGYEELLDYFFENLRIEKTE